MQKSCALYDLSITIKWSFPGDWVFRFKIMLEHKLPLQFTTIVFLALKPFISSLVGPKQIHCLTITDDRDKARIRTLYCNMVRCVCMCKCLWKRSVCTHSVYMTVVMRLTAQRTRDKKCKAVFLQHNSNTKCYIMCTRSDTICCLSS